MPVVVDCDPGTDDAIALMLAIGSGLDVRLVTAVGGNVGLPQTLRNARALVGLTGAVIPVMAGVDRPILGQFAWETGVHGENGLGGIVLPDGPPATPGHAVDAIRALLRAAGPAEVTLLGLGPATNLALALALEPALAAKVGEIVLMTGAWSEGNVTPSAEFNAWSDPEALAMLLAAGPPVTLATLELTAQALCTPARLASLRAGEGACRRAGTDIMASVAPSRRLGGLGHAQHDACAAMWLVEPDLFTHRPAHVTVERAGPARGRTIVDRWGRNGQPPNARLLETLDPNRFFATLARALAQLP